MVKMNIFDLYEYENKEEGRKWRGISTIAIWKDTKKVFDRLKSYLPRCSNRTQGSDDLIIILMDYALFPDTCLCKEDIETMRNAIKSEQKKTKQEETHIVN